MKKNKKVMERNEAQDGNNIEGLPVKNAMTNSVKNTALNMPGLNQANTVRDDLLPSDGDNMTN